MLRLAMAPVFLSCRFLGLSNLETGSDDYIKSQARAQKYRADNCHLYKIHSGGSVELTIMVTKVKSATLLPLLLSLLLPLLTLHLLVRLLLPLFLSLAPMVMMFATSVLLLRLLLLVPIAKLEDS